MQGFTITQYTTVRDRSGRVVGGQTVDLKNLDLFAVMHALQMAQADGLERVSKNRAERTECHPNGSHEITRGIRVLES